MDKKWYLIVVTLVALSAIIMGTACAVESMIIGPSGEVTDAVDQLPCDTVAYQVNIAAGWWINRLEMVVKTPDGATQSLGVHGYPGGNVYPPITLAEGEYITDVSGDFTYFNELTLLNTIKIETNLGNTYDSYGGVNPGFSSFDYEAPDGWQIVGFTTNPGAITSFGVIAIPVAECCKNVECEDAPCVKCDLETTTCTAPGEGQPHMMCDDGCVNTQNDDFNCGACGNECDTDAGQKCVSGVCTAKKTK